MKKTTKIAWTYIVLTGLLIVYFVVREFILKT